MFPQQRGIDFRSRRRGRPLPQQEEVFARLRAHRFQSLLLHERPPSTQIPFKDRESGCDGHVMTDESIDQILRLGSTRVHVGESFIALALATDVEFLVRIKLSIYKEAVLEIINTEFGGLFVGYRAQV